MKLGPRRVGESYAEDMRETRFPIHVPENVPGTKVQEHDWEIAGASVSSVSRPCGRRLGSRACPCVRVRVLNAPRVLAVWRSGSGRMASGLSPRGVASFVHASPCPNGALWWLTPVGTQDLPWAFFSLRPFRAWTSGGRAVANAPCGSGFGGAGSGGLTTAPEAVAVVTPAPVPHVREDRSAASAVK